MKRKVLLPVIAVALLLCCAVSGTLAWLMDKTDAITNTFTVGNVGITLEESTTNYKMVPGCEIAKDPTVTVAANSEKCYVFVKVNRSDNFDSFMVCSEWHNRCFLPCG